MNTVPRFPEKPDSPAFHIRVSSVMHDGVLTCSRDTTLRDVARLMTRRQVHCVVVTDEIENPGSLWGLVSDLDLVAAAGVRDLEAQTAGATAATVALTVKPDEDLQRAAQLMTEHGIAHLVVVNEAHHPIGVVSTLDIAAALGDEQT